AAGHRREITVERVGLARRDPGSAAAGVGGVAREAVERCRRGDGLAGIEVRRCRRRRQRTATIRVLDAVEGTVRLVRDAGGEMDTADEANGPSRERRLVVAEKRGGPSQGASKAGGKRS